MQLISIVTTTSLLTNVIADISEVEFYDRDAKAFCEGISFNGSSPSLTDKYSAYHLKNKLEIIIHEHNDPTRLCQASLSVGVGSSGVSKKHPVLEQPIPEGLPHLLEHCLFFASQNFPDPYSFHRFLKLSDGVYQGSTGNDYTIYKVKLKPRSFPKGLIRLASIFISPLFNAESVKTEISIVNNEWYYRKDRSSFISARLPQLLMTKGEPSELFGIGNAKTLNGDIDTLVDQVKQFWKTHYTADNMKLAISVSEDDKQIVEQIISKLFARIPESDPENIAPLLNSNPVPFWSPDHYGQYLKAYIPNNRRNQLRLYWNIHCDKGAVCYDSIAMILQALRSTFVNKNFYVTYNIFSYNEFVIEIVFEVRNQGLSKLTYIKDQIIDTVRTKACLSSVCQESSFEFDYSMKFTDRLSLTMLRARSLTEVPLRAHAVYIKNATSQEVQEEHWNVLLTEDPQIAITYKSIFLEEALAKESLSVDPYHPIYYQFVDNIDDDPTPVAPSPVVPDSRISLTIMHPVLPYPFLLFRGIFVEMLGIILNDKKINFKSHLENNFFNLDIYLNDPELWESTMQSVVNDLDFPSTAVFDKAKNRWLRYLQQEDSNKYLEDIAIEYGKILTNKESSDEYTQLISDPNPQSLSIQIVPILKHLFRNISAQVNFEFEPNELEADQKIKFMWNEKLSRSKTTVKFVQPSKDEAFIYAPPPISKETGGVMLLFEFDGRFKSHIGLVEAILSPFLFKILRTEMKLIYSHIVDNLSNTHLYIMASSPVTPEVLQNSIISAIKIFPDYIKNLSNDEWEELLNDFLQPAIRQSYNGSGSKSKLIQGIRDFLFGDLDAPRRFGMSGKSIPRLTLQFWGKDQGAAREKYLAEIERNPPPRTKIIRSIKEYPRE